MASPTRTRAYTEEDLYEFLSGFSSDHVPGTKRSYSNLGVALLGRLLADHLNTTYEKLVTERVLEPLGMDDTTIALTDDQERRLAEGHDPYMYPIRTWEMATLQASGSLRSTANDMLKLLAAYFGYASAGGLTSAMALQLREGITLDGRFQPLGWGRAT